MAVVVESVVVFGPVVVPVVVVVVVVESIVGEVVAVAVAVNLSVWPVAVVVVKSVGIVALELDSVEVGSEPLCVVAVSVTFDFVGFPKAASIYRTVISSPFWLN